MNNNKKIQRCRSASRVFSCTVITTAFNYWSVGLFSGFGRSIVESLCNNGTWEHLGQELELSGKKIFPVEFSTEYQDITLIIKNVCVSSVRYRFSETYRPILTKLCMRNILFLRMMSDQKNIRFREKKFSKIFKKNFFSIFFFWNPWNRFPKIFSWKKIEKKFQWGWRGERSERGVKASGGFRRA